MRTQDVVPTTLIGVKRLAKSFASEQGMSHARALDAASQAAGFPDYRNARKAWASASSSTEGHCAFLSAGWRDKGQQGMVSLIAPIPFDLSTISTKDLLALPGMSGFTVYGGLIQHPRRLFGSRTSAAQLLGRQARRLAFAMATGLRGSNSRYRTFPKQNSGFNGFRDQDRAPHSDHATVWYDRDRASYVTTDEPYWAEYMGDPRDDWSRKTGWRIAESEWGGMWFPEGGTKLFLIGDEKKGSLDTYLDAIASLPAPISYEACADV